MDKNKRFSISLSDEMNETLKKTKTLLYSQISTSQMITDLIERGLQATIIERTVQHG